MALQCVFPREVVATCGANEPLMATAASHSLVCMSMGIVGATKRFTAALGAFDTAAHEEFAMGFFMCGLPNALGTMIAPGAETFLGGDGIVLDNRHGLRRRFLHPAI